MYVLTEEGKRYLKKGLPEQRLCELLDKDEENIKKLCRMEDFSVALSWCKKNGWIEFKGDKLVLKKRPKKYEHFEALKKIASGENISEETIRVLESRKLITKKIEKKLREEKEIGPLPQNVIKTGLWKNLRFKKYNISIVGKRFFGGKRHPYAKFLDDVRNKLVQLGFKEMEGPTVEMQFWNFDALYQPQGHSARGWSSTYVIEGYGRLTDKKFVDNVKRTHENGWKTGSTGWKYKWDQKIALMLMPRAQCTCLSARTLASGPEIPGKYFAVARCYRPDVVDATHNVEFNQTEGIVLDESLTFRDLLGMLKMFAIDVAGAEKVKFYPDYYPFTEPSVQLSVKHPSMGWLEFGGAGIFREEVTLPLGVDVPVIAWGLGIDRLAMFKFGIDDIRNLFSYNLKWLREVMI